MSVPRETYRGQGESSSPSMPNERFGPFLGASCLVELRFFTQMIRNIFFQQTRMLFAFFCFSLMLKRVIAEGPLTAFFQCIVSSPYRTTQV